MPDPDASNNTPDSLHDPLALPDAGDRDRQFVRGGVITLLSTLLTVALTMGATIVLARLLKPEDFGLLAMAGVLLMFLDKFRKFGLVDAVIQHRDLDVSALSGLFRINVRLSAVVLLLALLASPVLALFFGRWELVWIIAAIAAANFVHGLSTVHEGLIRRRFQFGKTVAINFFAAAAGVASAITAAAYGLGYWALVLQELARELLLGVMFLVGAGWVPRRGRADAASHTKARQMLRYGGSLSVSNVVAYLGRNLDYVLVGTLSGAGALGLYHKAFQWANFPQQQVFNPAMRVAMSKLSRLQGHHTAYRASVRRTLLTLYGILAPLFTLLYIKAGPVILVLLGEQWTEAIPLFRLLLIGVFFHSLIQLTKWVYKAEGRAGDHLKQTLITSPTLALGVGIGAFWGPVGIAIGFDIACGLLVPVVLWLCLKDSLLRVRDLAHALWAPLCASLLAAAAAAWVVSKAGLDNHLLILGASLLVMCPLYLLCLMVLPGGRHRIHELRVAFSPMLQRHRADADPAGEDADAPAGRDNPLSP